MISENTSLQIGQFSVTVLENLGQRNGHIRYFKVRFHPEESGSGEMGLLRVGPASGLLQQELQLRDGLGEYALVAPLLAQTRVAHLSELCEPPPAAVETGVQNAPEEWVSLPSQRERELTLPVLSLREEREPLAPSTVEGETATEEAEITGEEEPDVAETCESVPADSGEETMTGREPDSSESGELANQNDYLEEEFYPEEPLPGDEGDRLVLLTAFPDSQRTLRQWLADSPTPVNALTTTAQICQLLWYLYQNRWCTIDLDPDFLEIGKPIRCFDLTCAYPEGTTLTSGLMGTYCAPELAATPLPSEKASTYTVGALLYHALYGRSLAGERSLDLKDCSIPRFSQLLSLSLSPIPDDRFSLAQLRSLLIETRNSLSVDRVSWEIASESTVGLSPRRLHNEDSYGIAQIESGQSDIVVLAALADGMGGMARGELASRLAVNTVLDGLREEEGHNPEMGSEWLVSLVERANAKVSEAVNNGGTTLSLVLAKSRRLAIAHVGDSRIYLLSNGELRQLSEDHSLVALLVASGQISVEESQQHPDRNVLIKSLGSKKQLSQGYVQTVGDIQLHDGDVLLLCSDGVWDLVGDRELMELFSPSTELQSAVNTAIARVLQRGAPDNATLLALRCRVSPVEVNFQSNSNYP